MNDVHTTPGAPHLELRDTLVRPLLDRWENQPQATLFAHRVGDSFVDVPVEEAVNTIRGIAKGLIQLGVQHGDRVVVMAPTRIEWGYLDYAILMTGAVTVPIFETSSAAQVEWIIHDSGAKVAFFSDSSLRALFEEVASRLGHCEHVFVIDDGAIEDLVERGRSVDDAILDDRIETTTTDDVATLIYTSGTTGRPKGCILTHENLRSNTLQVRAILGDFVEPGDRTMLFLPLAHSFAKILFYFPVEMGVPVAFATNLAALPEELPMVAPHWVAAVPRVFEKFYMGAHRKAHHEGKGAIFERAAGVASRYSLEASQGRVGLSTKVLHGLFDRLLYSKLRAIFGGNLRFAFSGGGPLGERLTHFFNGSGVMVLEGYGLTETSPVLTANLPDRWKIGSVGQPVPGTTIRIADDGEVLAKGPQVFQGYWQNEDATAEAIDDDGWFHTGDLGALDPDGYLRITGRKKDILVTAGGKNVAPALLEDLLRADPLISQAMVIGDREPFVSALITIDEEAFADWAEEHDYQGKSVADLADDPVLREAIREAVERTNREVSRAESIREFVILPRDLTVEGGALTPTLKVKRNVVLERERQVVDRIYGRTTV